MGVGAVRRAAAEFEARRGAVPGHPRGIWMKLRRRYVGRGEQRNWLSSLWPKYVYLQYVGLIITIETEQVQCNMSHL